MRTAMSIATSEDQPKLDTIGDRIHAVRKAKHLPLTSTATQIGISRTSLRQWENGKVRHPNMAVLGKFAKLADVNQNWLLRRAGDDPEFLAGMVQKVPSSATVNLPEVAASLIAHAQGVNKTSRSSWVLPRDVIELSFSCDPDASIIMRVAVSPSTGETGIKRGDYLLIDTS